MPPVDKFFSESTSTIKMLYAYNGLQIDLVINP